MKKYPDCKYIEMDTENIEGKKNTEFSELNFLRNVRSIFSDWMRRKEFDPQENLKHIFFAALELWRIWQENSNEDFLFSDDFNAQIKKNLKEYKTQKLQKELADAISKIPSDQESAIFEQNELFLDLTTNYEREGLYKSEAKAPRPHHQTYLTASLGHPIPLFRDISLLFKRKLDTTLSSYAPLHKLLSDYSPAS